VDISVVISNEAVISKPLAGAGKPNSACPATPPEPIRGDDNAASIGALWQFGKFRMADLGDLLQWAEIKLMCPNNPMGTVDLFMVNHHGLDRSNSPAMVHGLQPKVAIVNNGERKGISPDVAKTLRSSPGRHLAAIIDDSGPELNARAVPCQHEGPGLPGVQDQDLGAPHGSFTVTNARNNFSKTYKP
jgi:hypothetical protein